MNTLIKTTLIKTTLGLAALMIAVPASTTVMAQEFKPEFAPYVGFDLMHYNVSYSDGGDQYLEDGLNGLNIHVGNRFSKYFGAELGYARTRDEDKDIAAGTTIVPGLFTTGAGKTKVQLQSITLDAMGYLPLDQEERFELIGTAGISWTKADLNLNVPTNIAAVNLSDDDSEFSFRVGAGAQFNITDNVSVRGLARYQKADFDDMADRAWVYSAGLNFSF